MAVSASNANERRIISQLSNAGLPAGPAEHCHPIIRPRIWVAYVKRGRNFLDTAPQMPNTEQQINALQEYHKQKFTASERFTRKWIFCQQPIVLIGELYGDQPNNLEDQRFPQEVQFDRLQISEALTKSFLHSQSLHRDRRFYNHRGCFNVRSTNYSNKRKVLCVGHKVKKGHLIGPLLVSLCISFVTAAVATVLTHSLSTGVGIGGIIEAMVVLVWSFIMWYLK